MDCGNCGACCLDESIPVMPRKGDVIAAEYIDEEGCLRKVDGHCIFFDTKTRSCGNYEHRPWLCRSLDIGCGRCHLARLWAELVLDWSKPEASSSPVPLGSYERFYKTVSHVEGSMRIASIAGAEDEKTAAAVSSYNRAVAGSSSW